MDGLPKKIASDFICYTTATYLTQGLGVVTSIAIRYFLEPSLMGVWSLLDLLLNYGLYSNLGVLTALYTEIPYYLGKKDFQKAREIRDVSFSFTLLGALAAGALFVLWAVFAGPAATPQLRIGVAVVALILIATSVYNFYVGLMWATKDFQSLSKGIVINAALFLSLVLVFVSRAKLNGLLAAVLLSTSASAVYLASRSKTGDLRIRLDKKELTDLLKTSLPLVTTGFVYALFLGMDRLIIVRYLGITALGHYSIALLVIAYAEIVPKLLAIIVFPNMQENFGESGSRVQIRRFVIQPATLLAYGSPLLLGTAYLVVPHLVRGILPKYEPGLASMKIFLLGAFFISLCQPIQTYLTTIYKRWQTLPIIASAAGVAFVFSYFLIRNGFALNAVALGMSAGFFVYYTAILFYVFGHFCSRRETFFFYGETLACFVYYALVVWGISRFVHPFQSFLLNGASQFLALGSFGVPLLWIANKKTAAFSTLWLAVTRRASPGFASAKEGL